MGTYTVRHSFEYINSFFEFCGYQLRQDFYEGGDKRIKCICPNGHKTAISYNNLRTSKKRGKTNGCPRCGRISQAEKRSKHITEDRIVHDLRFKIIPANGGKFPAQKDKTINVGYHLPDAIKNHGGYQKFRKLLGFNQIRKPNGFWHEWNNVEKEIKSNFSLTDAVFPSYEQLETAKIPISYVCKIHSLSLPELADKFGCVLASVYKCRDGHFVSSVYECIVDEYLYSRHISHTVHPKVNKYYADFLVADCFVEVWGYPRNDTSKLGIFYNEKRRKKELMYYRGQHDLLSIEFELLKNWMKDWGKIERHLDDAFINRGYDTRAKENFDTTIVIAASFTWTESAVKDSLKSIMSELGHFPKSTELKGLYPAVRAFGGLRHFRKLMAPAEKMRRKRSVTMVPDAATWSKDLVLHTLDKWCKKLGYCPTQMELQELDTYLLHGINTFGGLEKFKILMGLQKVKPRNYWNEKTIMEEFRKLGRVPSTWELGKNKNHSLSNAINRHGGIKYFRLKFTET